jgi:hypothetical protein
MLRPVAVISAEAHPLPVGWGRMWLGVGFLLLAGVCLALHLGLRHMSQDDTTATTDSWRVMSLIGVFIWLVAATIFVVGGLQSL